MKSTVILVDDDPNVLSSVKRCLAKAPFRLLTAQSAQQCVDLLAITDVQVVVADLMMPGFSGAVLIDYFKESRPDVVRIVLSGNLNEKITHDLINRGKVFRCLAKPCTSSELSSAIHDALMQAAGSHINPTSAQQQRIENQSVSDSTANNSTTDLENLVRDATAEVERLERALHEQKKRANLE